MVVVDHQVPSVTGFRVNPQQFLDLFKADETRRRDATFRALNDLFFAVDACRADPALQDTDDFYEAQLRDRVAIALVAISTPSP